MAIAKIRNVSISSNVFAAMAVEEDEQAISQLYLHTAVWLKESGSTQWSGLLQGLDHHNTAAAIRRREVFAFRNSTSQELVGSVILQQQPSEWDRNLWGDDTTDRESAVYLHRLVVNRKYAGHGIGSQIMTWVEHELAGHFASIKLDCVAFSTKLNHFYRQHGYEYRGEKNGYSKYQKWLTPSSTEE